jgi:uncharacterized membrane protein YgdD (TMEM256/DUF423 family)
MTMPVNVHPDMDTGVGSLVSGIVDDAQELLKQQIALLKHEVRTDIRNALMASAFLAVGAVISLFGGLLLFFMVPYLINYLAPSIPIWVCFAIVGGVVLLIGLVMLGIGREKLRSSALLPKESIASFKENLEWTTKPK